MTDTPRRWWSPRRKRAWEAIRATQRDEQAYDSLRLAEAEHAQVSAAMDRMQTDLPRPLTRRAARTNR